MPLSSLSLSGSNSDIRLVLDSMFEAFYVVDTEGVTTLCNAVFLNLLGYTSEEEVVGRKLHYEIHHSHPDGSPYEVDSCPIFMAAKGIKSSFVKNEYFFRKDGTRFPVEYHTRPIIKEGKPCGAICTFIDISEQNRKNIQINQLQEEKNSETERINLALDSGTIVGTWVWDVVHNHFIGDERFARTFSLDAEALRNGLKIEQIVMTIHPDDITEVQHLIHQAIEKGGPYSAQYRVLQHDQSWLWIEANGKVEKNEQDQSIRFPGVLINIDERKRTELALKESEQRYSVLFQAMDQGFSIIDITFDASGKALDYVFKEVNPAFETHTGLRNVVGKNALSIMPTYEQTGLDSYGDVVKTGKAVRFEKYVQSLNRWFDVNAFKIGNEHSTKVGVLFNDITARRIADLALQESEAHLSLMVESAHDYAIISIDTQGIINRWNKGAERIFGSYPDEVIGKSIAIIFTEEDLQAGALQHEISKAIENGRASDERWHLRANGERFYASGIMASMLDEQGKIKGLIKIARDMTIERRLQEELIAAKNFSEAANIAKTDFLANMSHEIRTPMNAIIGLSTLLSKSQPLTQKQSDYIRTLQLSADSLLALINDLLDIAKIEARSVELEHIPFNITVLVQEVISMMGVKVREKGLTFTGDGECVAKRMFMGDPTRIRQIVLNLCSNAVKFTEQGHIHVAITCHSTDRDDIETICIAVEDTGIGIAEDKRATIFDKFVQADTSISRKYGGTGLGLAITKTLTEIMDGTITVESEAGKGSLFKVCLPLKIATHQNVAESDLSLSAVAEGTVHRTIKATILLVEDYEPNIMVASAFLEEFGYCVEVAKNGLEAFEMAKQRNYALILMDVQMHGVNGFEATQLIREYERKNNLEPITIMGMTAHAFEGDRERCLSIGMNAYIAKPFNPRELQNLLAQYID